MWVILILRQNDGCPCAWGITVTNEAKPMCSYCWLKTKSKTPWCWLCQHPIFDSPKKAHLSECHIMGNTSVQSTCALFILLVISVCLCASSVLLICSLAISIRYRRVSFHSEPFLYPVLRSTDRLRCSRILFVKIIVITPFCGMAIVRLHW